MRKLSMEQVIELNRHAQLERKWLKEDMKEADLYAKMLVLGATIFTIVVGIIRAYVLGIL